MRFVIGFFALGVTIQAAIVGFNMVHDSDGRLWRGYPEERRLAEKMLQGYDVAGPQQMRLRVLAVEIIEQATTQPHAVVIGSSRAMLIGEELLGFKGVRNHSVPSARLLDYMGIIGFYQRKGMTPPLVIIGVDPWIFKDEKINVSPMEPGVRFMARRMEVEAERLGMDEKLLWRAYFSGQKAWVAIQRRSVGEGVCAELQYRANDDSPCAVRRHDGTLRYPLYLRSRPGSVVDAEVQLGARGGMHTYEGYRALDPARVQAFGRFLATLKLLDGKVVIVLPPYHPIVERINRNRRDWDLTEAAEHAIRQAAAKVAFPVIGSYSAARAGCRAEEFYDAIHAKESCIATILAQQPGLLGLNSKFLSLKAP